jgi:hypothetical protein
MVDIKHIVVLHTAGGGVMLDISDNMLEITGSGKYPSKGSALTLNLCGRLLLIAAVYWLVVQAVIENDIGISNQCRSFGLINSPLCTLCIVIYAHLRPIMTSECGNKVPCKAGEMTSRFANLI